jgi:hypothetical protein
LLLPNTDCLHFAHTPTSGVAGSIGSSVLILLINSNIVHGISCPGHRVDSRIEVFVFDSVIENDQDKKEETILHRKTEEEHQYS